jgi:Na+/glutamate symporter
MHHLVGSHKDREMKQRSKKRAGGAAVEYVLGFAMMTLVLCAIFQLARAVMGSYFDFGSMAALRPWL